MVGVDIYPLDFVPADEAERERVRQEFRLVWNTRRLARKEDRTEEEEENLGLLLHAIEAKYAMQFDNKKPIVGQLVSLANRIAASVKEEDADALAVYHNFLDLPRRPAPIQCYEQIDWMPFENIFVPVPHGYDTILTYLYGDYRTIIKGGCAHDYPFYKKQLEWLRKLSGDR